MQAHKVLPDHKVLRASRVLLDNPVQMAQLDRRDREAPRVSLGRKVGKDQPVTLDCQDQLERQVRADHKDPEVSQVLPDLPVPVEHWDRWVIRDCLGSRVPMDSPVQRELPETPAKLVRQATLALRVWLDLAARPDSRAERERLATPDSQDSPDR